MCFLKLHTLSKNHIIVVLHRCFIGFNFGSDNKAFFLKKYEYFTHEKKHFIESR